MMVGAQTPERAITVRELESHFQNELSSLDSEIERLDHGGYVESFERDGVKHLYLSLSGIIAASSLYS